MSSGKRLSILEQIRHVSQQQQPEDPRKAHIERAVEKAIPGAAPGVKEAVRAAEMQRVTNPRPLRALDRLPPGPIPHSQVKGTFQRK